MSTSSSSSRFSRSMHRKLESVQKNFYYLSRSPLAIVGLIVVLFYVILAIIGPFIVGGNPSQMRQIFFWQGNPIYYTPLPPSHYFPFGTTFGGYDILNGVVKGARTDLSIAAIIVFSGAIVGTFLGSIAGYKGGLIGDIIMRVTDVFLSIPYIVLAMALLFALGRTEGVMIAALVVVWWPSYTRIVRGQVLTVRESKYVEASRASGSSQLRTVLLHVIPNSIYPIFVQISLDFGNVILTLAALFFLGFTFAGPGLAEWGNLIGLATSIGGGGMAMIKYPWTIVIPGLVILALVLSLNLLGDGLRDIFDPRLKK